MWNKVFDPENFFFRQMARLTDLLCLSLLWVFLSLPLITLGAATAALYDCVVRCVRGGEGHTYRRFFRTFKSSFAVSALSTLLWGAVWVWLVYAYRTLLAAANAGSRPAAALYVAYGILLVLPAGIVCWMFPILSRFENTVKSLTVVSFQLAVSHLPSTVVAVLLTAEAAIACARYWWPVILLPAVTALLWSLFFERVFEKYAPKPAP